MGAVKNFSEEKSKLQDAKQLKEQSRVEIEQNSYLQYAIKVVSNLDMNDESANVLGLLEDYKADCEKNGTKFQSLGEIDNNKIQFYYQLLQVGYRTFGANFFKMMCMNPANCIQLFIGIWALINGLEQMSDTVYDISKELNAFKALDLSEEQKEKYNKLMSQSQEEFISNLMTQAEKLEKEQEENHIKNNLMKDEQDEE